MTGLLKMSAFALALAVSATAFGEAVPLVQEDFTNDTDAEDGGQWIGNGNRSNPGVNDYGWSNSDNTGTSVPAPSEGGSGQSGAGELGGNMERGNYSDYGFPTGDLDPLTVDGLHADGTYYKGSGSGNFFLGFYQEDGTPGDHMSVGNGDPRNFIGIQHDDGTGILVHMARYDNNQRDHHGPSHILPNTTIQWEFDYDPDSGTSFTINGEDYLVEEDSSYFQDGADDGFPTVFNRFGLFSSDTSDSSGQGFWDGHVTFSSHNPIPEPTSLGLLSLGGLALLGRRRK